MAKKYRGTQVYLKPDARFKSMLATKLINSIMKDGKKSTAERVFYTAMDTMQEKVKDQEPIKVLETAIENVRPLLEVRPRRVGGATYQVPMEVDKTRSAALAMRWITTYARERKGKTMSEKLGMELIEASKNEGAAIKKRADTHRMAEANKAFALYRW